MTLLKKCKEKPDTDRKHLQITCLVRHVPKYEHLKLNNKKNKPKRKPNKNGQKIEQMLIKDDIEMTNMCMTEVRHH